MTYSILVWWNNNNYWNSSLISWMTWICREDNSFINLNVLIYYLLMLKQVGCQMGSGQLCIFVKFSVNQFNNIYIIDPYICVCDSGGHMMDIFSKQSHVHAFIMKAPVSVNVIISDFLFSRTVTSWDALSRPTAGQQARWPAELIVTLRWEKGENCANVWIR